MKLSRVALTVLLLAAIAPALAWSEERPVLRGAVKQELVLDEAQLKSLPAVDVDVTFETGEGQKSGIYTGVLLWALLEKAAPTDEPGKKLNSGIRC